MATNDDEDSIRIQADANPANDDMNIPATARGTIYALLAGTFVDPDDELYQSIQNGELETEFATLLDRSDLDVTAPDFPVTDDRETLSARYNDLFTVGYSEVIDKTDGTMQNYGPPVSLYESAYRSDVSWNDVNLDLARAYEYFGCQVNQETRRNHDHLRLQLEFMGYLCRREATIDPDIARARLDFHDRHLRVIVSGIADTLASEPGTGFYGHLADFMDRFTAADVNDLAARHRDGDHK